MKVLTNYLKIDNFLQLSVKRNQFTLTYVGVRFTTDRTLLLYTLAGFFIKEYTKKSLVGLNPFIIGLMQETFTSENKS